jgi:EmrB/QacA subfamily drug resistance transporter
MGEVATSRQRWVILAILSLSLFLVVVDNTIVNVALPTVSRDLNAGTGDLQWIVDAYSLVFAGLLLASGSLGDRFGRKVVLQLGLVIFASCSVLAAFSSSTGQLIAARAAMGFGAALVFPATLAILTNVFTDPTERAKAIGIWSAVSGIAVALGPITGGFLLRHFWWGSVFLVNLPIVAVTIVSGYLLLPESRDPHAGRFDPLGFVLSIATIGLLVYTVIEAPRRGWLSPATLVGFGVAAALLLGFVAWEHRHPDPMLDVHLFMNPRFSAASASVSLAFFALFGFIFLVTQYFQFLRGYSALSAGVHTLPFAVAAGVMAPIGARFALRFGTRIAVAGGLAAMSVGLWWAATLNGSTAYWGPVAASMILIGGGLTLTTAPATASILGALPPEKAGVGSAVNDTTRELGGTLGVAIVGSVFASLYGPRIVDALTGHHLPASVISTAKESLGTAKIVATHAPEAVRPIIVHAANQGFLQGFAAGTRVAAGAAVLGVVVALVALPARERATDDRDLHVDSLPDPAVLPE